MFIVEKYDKTERRWRFLYKANTQAPATRLCYTLSMAHPDRSFRLIVVNQNTLKLFWPSVIYRGGAPVTH